MVFRCLTIKKESNQKPDACIAMVMFRLFILSLCLFLPGCSTAEGVPNNLPFTPIKQGVIEQNKLQEINGLKTLDGEPFTGTIIDRHPNGQLRLRRGSLNGKAHGVWIEWHENGQVRFYGEWNSGLGDGPFLYFWENGEIRERATAVKDIWEGVSEGWTELGEKRHETLHLNGELISKKAFKTTILEREK